MLTRRSMIAGFGSPWLGAQERSGAMFIGAENYERYMGRWSQLVAPLLLDFAGISQPSKVLDIGSGTGSMAFTIARLQSRSRVTGIDPTRDFVQHATQKNQYPGRVAFEEGDAQKLRFGNGSYDACVSLFVFNFIPDPARALNEARRVTRSGGVVSAAVWAYGDGMRMLRIFWDAAVSVDPSAGKLDERGMRLCREGELARLWIDGGLENVREAPLEITMNFSSFADYWDPFLLGIGPAGVYARALSPERSRSLRDELKRRLGVVSEDAPLTLPARAWAVRGAVKA